MVKFGKESVKYEALSVLHFSGNAVDTVEVQGGIVRGTVFRQSTDEFGWSVNPHIAIANLRTYDENGLIDMKPNAGLNLDEKAVEVLIRHYGVLFSKDLPDDARDLYKKPENVPPDLGFEEQMSELASVQFMLREAWTSRDSTLIEKNLQNGLEVSMRGQGELFIVTGDLWKFACLLFMLDEWSRKTAFCANPDCETPYFIKIRQTQKFCKAPACEAYATRIYVKKWWNDKGSKQRKKQRAAERKKRK